MSFFFPLFSRQVGTDLTPHLSVQTAATYSGYSPQYLRRLLRAGKLKGTKVGPIWLIDFDSLEDYLSTAQTVNDRRCGPKQLPGQQLVEVLS